MEQGCSQFMATDLSPVRATCKKKKKKKCCKFIRKEYSKNAKQHKGSCQSNTAF